MPQEHLQSLLERVRSVERGSRELDAILDAVLVHNRELVTRTYRPTGADCLCARNPKPPHDEYVVWCADATDIVRVLPYTSSLDASLALMEKVLPGWRFSLVQMASHWQADIALVDDAGSAITDHFEDGATPALALLAAILSAKIDEVAA